MKNKEFEESILLFEEAFNIKIKELKTISNMLYRTYKDTLELSEKEITMERRKSIKHKIGVLNSYKTDFLS